MALSDWIKKKKNVWWNKKKLQQLSIGTLGVVLTMEHGYLILFEGDRKDCEKFAYNYMKEN